MFPRVVRVGSWQARELWKESQNGSLPALLHRSRRQHPRPLGRDHDVLTASQHLVHTADESEFCEAAVYPVAAQRLFDESPQGAGSVLGQREEPLL